MGIPLKMLSSEVRIEISTFQALLKKNTSSLSTFKSL
jgi:hypothetical protein